MLEKKYIFIDSKAAQSFLTSGSVTSISMCVNINVVWKYVILFGLPSIKNLSIWLCRNISAAFKSNRNDNRITLIFISGGEGSRTPVQYKFHINFYIVSLLLLILQTKLFVFPNVRTTTPIDPFTLGRTTLSDYRSQPNWVRRFRQPPSLSSEC